MTLVTKSTTTAASGADCTESQFKQNITPAKWVKWEFAFFKLIT